MKRISLLVLVSSLSAQTTIAVVDFEAKGVSLLRMVGLMRPPAPHGGLSDNNTPH